MDVQTGEVGHRSSTMWQQFLSAGILGAIGTIDGLAPMLVRIMVAQKCAHIAGEIRAEVAQSEIRIYWRGG